MDSKQLGGISIERERVIEEELPPEERGLPPRSRRRRPWLPWAVLAIVAVITETIFQWPGLGRWSAEALLSLDRAVIMGFTILTAVIYVLVNLVVDVIYAYLDPRIRLGA